jgi:cell division protein FtsL
VISGWYLVGVVWIVTAFYIAMLLMMMKMFIRDMNRDIDWLRKSIDQLNDQLREAKLR